MLLKTSTAQLGKYLLVLVYSTRQMAYNCIDFQSSNYRCFFNT